jgi:hypothetical protein
MPIAFREYWREKYESNTAFLAECPAELMTCLKAMQDAYGWDLGVGRSAESDSDTVGSSLLISFLLTFIDLVKLRAPKRRPMLDQLKRSCVVPFLRM